MATTNGASWIDWARLVVGVLTLLSIWIAYQAYRTNAAKVREDRERERDKEFVSQFQRSLEWAYNVLTENGQHVPPKADRLNWLVSARHIVRARKIRDQITHQTYQTIADEWEEFWRHQFYLALSDPSLLSERYYMDVSRPRHPVNIQEASALVVVGLSSWKRGAVDPIDSLDMNDLMLNRDALQGTAASGLRSYILHLEGLRKSRPSNDQEI